MEYLLYFMLTLLLSTVFSMGGTGSGIALIPLLHLLGVEFNLSKTVGLFVGFSSTFSSTVMNFRRGVLELRIVLPLAVALWISAPLGAQLSRFVDEKAVKGLFILFLFFSASMMIMFKKQVKTSRYRSWILVPAGITVGLSAGLLGLGGGNLLLPILIMSGFQPRSAAVSASFVIPFSAFASFLSYAAFVRIDWIMLTVCAAGGIIGGFAGNHLMHERMSQRHIRYLIAILLYVLALKMLFSF